MHYQEIINHCRGPTGSNEEYYLDAIQNAAMCKYGQGDYKNADRLLHDALALKRKVLGNTHLSVAVTL